MEQEARLRLEYDHTTDRLQGLAETRFKLLGLVPTIAGVAVGFVSAATPAVGLVAIGLLGLVATGGVLVYELRNGQLTRAAAARVRELESELLGSRSGVDDPRRLFGFVRPSHALGIALVYGVALGAWSYVAAWGALRAFDVPSARVIGLAVGGAAGICVSREVERLETCPSESAATGGPVHL